MRPGDVVRFKAGLFGVPQGENLGIFLGRDKRKKTHLQVLWTVKGRKEFKPEQVGDRLLRGQLADPEDEEELRARLKEALGRLGEGKQVPQGLAVRGKGQLDEREAWLQLQSEGEFAAERAAEVLFGALPPPADAVAAVRDLLERCAQPGVGYFERAGRGNRWTALDPEVYPAIKRDIEALHRLKKKLVQIREEEWDGETVTVARGVPLEEAGLDEEDRRVLGLVQRAMEDFLLYDQWRGALGLGETPVHALDGFHLFTYVKNLASDWLSGGAGRTISSHFAEFLVESGLLSVEEGIRLLARRLVLASEGFTWDVPDRLTQEGDRLAERVRAEDPTNRRDLRRLETFTIDPATAKDFDDALTYQPEADGGATLWVHIADVSHYVEKDSILDRGARDRGTSVYLPTGVLPMLPPRLSDDLCSLRGGTDRPALSVRLRFDAQGRIVEEAFCESLIRLSKNWAYEQVDEAIQQDQEPFAGLHALAQRVRAHREGLDLDTGEREIRLDENEITHGEKRASPATRLIEVFMVAANESVARLLTRHEVPDPYRCHPLPDRSAVERFNGQMETMELAIGIALPERDAEAAGQEAPEEGGPSLVEQLKGGKFTLMGGQLVREDAAAPSDEEKAEREEETATRVAASGLAQLSEAQRAAWLKPFAQALRKVRAVPEALKRDLVTFLLLRTLGRAFYAPANYGHFGLGSTCYAHFTSPIRRYPDLLVHRQLRWLLRRLAGTSEDPAPSDIQAMQTAEPPGQEPPHAARNLAPFCETSTQRAVAAERLEWKVKDIALTFASRGEDWRGQLQGVVSGITAGGVYLTLPGGLEAYLRARDIPGGPFSVDDDASMLYVGSRERPEVQDEIDAGNWRQLVDEATGEVRLVKYRLGDGVPVRITGRDYAEGRVTVVPARG